MSISGISPQGFSRVNTLLGEVGRAIDPKSHAKTTVSDIEAKRIVQAFDKLEPSEKAEVAKALQALMQQDVFTVSDKARTTFAQALGVDSKNLEPQPKVSAAPTRTVMQQALQALTRPVQIDKKQLDELTKGLAGAPKPIGDFLVSALKHASEDGAIKMDPAARKDFTREYATREGSDGALGWMSQNFGESFAKRMPPYALQMLSNPPYFEEILAAFMMTLVNDTNQEVLRDQMRMDETLKADQARSEQKKSGQTQKIKDALAKDGATEPSPASPTTTEPQTGGRVMSTKTKLEAVVSSIDSRVADGFMSKEDASAVREKLERFHPQDPVTKLLGDALGTAMQHTHLLKNANVAERFKPISDWVQKVTGKTDFPKPTNISSDKPLARALMESDKIEQRMAGFLVDAFIRKGEAASGLQPEVRDAAASQTAMEKFAPVLEQILSKAGPTPEVAQTTPQQPVRDAMRGKFERLTAARDKIPAGAVDKTISNTVDNVAKELPLEQRQAVKQGLKSALDSLPKDAKPEQVNAAFERATAALVTHTESTMKPDELEAKTELLDGALDKAKQRATDRIDHAADAGKPLSPEEQQAVLFEEVGKAKAGLFAEAKGAGYDAKALEGLGTTFDKLAGDASQELAKEGKLTPTSPGGMGHADDPTESDNTRSRQMMFEKLKFKMNMLSEMMQAMSNVLNTLHTNAENAIRNIR